MNIPHYPFTISELSENEGGGFLIEFPDLPGCMSDGESLEETIANGNDAVKCWLYAAKETGRDIPEPGDFEKLSGRWVQRAPRSLHAKLTKQAKRENVSLNTLVISILSEALGYKMQQ